jgi:hypothetical protein
MSTPTADLGTIVTSATARKAIYSVYVLAALAVTGTQIAFASIQVAQPSWLIATLAVIAYLGIPVGTLAISNTSTPAPVAPVEIPTAPVA